MKARLFRAFAGLLLPGASASIALGCAGDRVADRQVNRLQEEIRNVQSERDRMDERLAALEIQSKGVNHPGAESPDGAAAAQVETPKLRVIRLEPEGAPQGESSAPRSPDRNSEADEGVARPAVRVTGVGRRSTARKRAGSGEIIVEDRDAPSPESAPPRPSVFDPEARRAYDVALDLLHSRKYDEALEAFAGFLVRWPDHPNADNAFYWRGECYFAEGNYQKAAEQFEATIMRFPLGNKVPDALLKLSMSQEKLGDRERARRNLDRLAREYPQSEAARRIPREGRGR